MKKLLFKIFLFFACCSTLAAQSSKDSIYIQAKIWSRDANRNIQYSNWKSFACKTVDLLKNFKPSTNWQVDKYGGDTSIQFKANGFFYTTIKNNRWWIVNPIGHASINMAVNGVRLGKSPNNIKAFSEKYSDNSKWIEATKKILDEDGFNATGSWSDIETIKAYNTSNANPIVYTTQLSLLASFSQKQKKKANKNEYPILANVFNVELKKYCSDKTKDIVSSKNEANLLGHFSDNELPFQENLLKAFLEINDTNDAAYVTAVKWVTDNNVDALNSTKEQKDAFSGFVANAYYQLMHDVIKAADPNHLYLGSRLHSSAKNNPYILVAAEKYVDIISINYYGNWSVSDKHKEQWEKLSKPFIITEFYTKGEDSKMSNMTGAGWLVKTQEDRGIHYQNFCLTLLQIKNCVGWHWFRYQDNDPTDTTADPSNNDANKGIVNTTYDVYKELTNRMKQLNENAYQLIKYFDKK